MAPPKELVVDEGGELRLKSFSGFWQLVKQSYSMSDLPPLQPFLDNPTAFSQTETGSCWFGNESGFEMFLLDGDYQDFILTGDLYFEGNGKCGLVLRLNEAGDGYYLSLDLFKGIAQIRAWGHRGGNITEESFEYRQLQAAHYVAAGEPHSFQLIAYEQYLEFSLHGYVLLTLADDHFRSGRLGFYVESAKMRAENLELHRCRQSKAESYPGDVPNY